MKQPAATGGEYLEKQEQVQTPEQLDKLERLEVVSALYGFFPTTQEELNSAVGLIAFLNTPGKSARQLNEILLHQQKANTDDPKQAVLSKVAEYGWFAVSAKNDSRQLSVLKSEIDEMMNPKVSILDELEPGQNLIGQVQLARFVDVKNFLVTKGNINPPFNLFKKAERKRDSRGDRKIIDVYSTDTLEPAVSDHVLESLGATTVKASRLLIREAINDQVNREHFWTDRLVECKSHLLAKPIAIRALNILAVQE